MTICNPALVYLIIAMIAIVSMVYLKISASTIAIKGLFIIIWTWFLNFLCTSGHEGVSWFLVVLPYVITLLIVFIAKSAISHAHEHRHHNRHDN